MVGFAGRCDRILWKSTIEPCPDSNYGELEVPLHPKAKSRVGRFFVSFFRSRKGSYSSSACSGISNNGHSPSGDGYFTPSRSAPGSPPPVGRRNSVQCSRFFAPEISVPDLVVSGSKENTNVANFERAPGVGILRSFSVDRARSDDKGLPRRQRPSRPWTTPTKSRPLSATPLFMEPAPRIISPKDDQAAKNGASRWRLLPFLRGDSSYTTTPVDPGSTSEERTEMTTSFSTCMPRKGDVVCLGYDSLDDKAMGRLEGRSDHRPVIGSFGIYL